MKRLILSLALALMVPSYLSPAVQDPLDAWYVGYNHAYFQDRLPKTVIISHSLDNDYRMAETTPFTNNYYHIDFNPKYGYHPGNGTSITELRNLLHEMCHVQVFVENAYEFDDHGAHWQGCMHRLADMRAFDNLW